MREGEIVALIGESGSGKTTMRFDLMGYARPGCRISGGSVTVDGKDMVALSEKGGPASAAPIVAYVPQSAAAAFNPAATIMEQVIEITRIHDLMPADEAEPARSSSSGRCRCRSPRRSATVIRIRSRAASCSGLSAAMALISDPKLVIFDEPTTALDVTTQIEVLRAFKSVMRTGGIAGVYVSHDLAVVAQIADRIVVLKGGEVQETGSTATNPLGCEAPLYARTARCFRTQATRAARTALTEEAPSRDSRISSPATVRFRATGCRSSVLSRASA